MNETATSVQRYSISEAAKKLDRSPHTLRSWDRNGSMPKRLRPKRDLNGNRYWTDELIEEIKTWIDANGFHPGRGIDYHPTKKQLAEHINRIRQSSRSKSSQQPEHEDFRKTVEQAIKDIGMSHERIVKMLPDVIDGFEPPISLDEALRIVSDVFSS